MKDPKGHDSNPRGAPIAHQTGIQRIATDTKPPLRVLGAYDVDQSGNVMRKAVDTSKPGDYGHDPVGDGTFRMVPSGDIVDYAELKRRLGK